MSVLFATVLFGATAHAVPAQFTHQGRLLDADGLPLEGETSITFRVTAAESGGDSLWEEALSVELSSGFYSVILGTDEESNPLDSEVFSQAPVWLELQIDGEPAMFPRSAIQAVPYANMAQVAEEVDGGPVNASDISVGGTPVINDDGEWIGPTPSIDWSDIEGIPADFADGVDDDTDTDTDTDSFADLALSCVDGDIPVWDAIVGEWNCDMDQDTQLSEDEVDAYVENNGYAMATDVFGGNFSDLAGVPDGLSDGDDDTYRSDEEIREVASSGGFDLDPSTTIGGSAIATADEAGVPSGVIVMWSGTTPPDGWVLCNGSTGTPDLRDRFIVASGSSHSVGDQGEGSTGVSASTVTVIKGSAHGSEWRTTALSSISGSTPVPRYYALAFIMKI